MGLVRVHASHNLPVDRSGAHPAAPFSRLEIGEDLGLVREGNKKKKKNCELLPKGGGGGDPKVHNLEILNFGKFQVSKWASGMKRLFKVSFKN